jgi:integrase
MAEAKRRGYGEDGIYFDHRGVVSLGFSADGKRVRKKVSGKTRAEVKDKLRLAGRRAGWPHRQDGGG